ncbi:MAG: hypothetical protein H7Y10_05055 [Flavobacterium sp.]|nr:hypothetical protein [Flavobacterium sp.]
MNLKLNKSISLLFLFFFILSLLFPTTIFNKVIFIILMGFTVLNHKIYKLKTVSPFFVFFIFLFGFIYSFFNNSDSDLRLQFFLSVLVLFLIYPILKYKIDIDYIAKVSGLVMALYTGISFLIIVTFMNSPISGAYYKLFFEVSSGGYSLREFGEEGTLSFHVGTVPFIYLSFVLYVKSFIEKKKTSTFLIILILSITIYVSVSRGLIISCIVGAGYIVFFKTKLVNKIIFLMTSIPLLVITILYLMANTGVFSSGETSNSIKIGHYVSFVEHIDFFNFFIGEGLASYYYSKGTNSMLAHTEITPLDMIRYFGFILATLLYFVIVFPSKKITSYLGPNSLYVVLFLIYVINSMTNPIMFNSYGLLIVLWYWNKILCDRNVNSGHDFETPAT